MRDTRKLIRPEPPPKKPIQTKCACQKCAQERTGGCYAGAEPDGWGLCLSCRWGCR